MSNQFVQKIASVVLVLGIFVSLFMAAQNARAGINPSQPTAHQSIE